MKEKYEPIRVATVEESIKKDIPFKAGMKVIHARLGRGIVIGFSEISGEPSVYFYDYEIQKRYRNECVSVFSGDLIIC